MFPLWCKGSEVPGSGQLHDDGWCRVVYGLQPGHRDVGHRSAGWKDQGTGQTALVSYSCFYFYFVIKTCLCVFRFGRSRAVSVWGDSNVPTAKEWRVWASVKTAASSSAPPSTRPSGELQSETPNTFNTLVSSKIYEITVESLDNVVSVCCSEESMDWSQVKRWRSSVVTPHSSTRPRSHRTVTTSSAPPPTGRWRWEKQLLKETSTLFIPSFPFLLFFTNCVCIMVFFRFGTWRPPSAPTPTNLWARRPAPTSPSTTSSSCPRTRSTSSCVTAPTRWSSWTCRDRSVWTTRTSNTTALYSGTRSAAGTAVEPQRTSGSFFLQIEM